MFARLGEQTILNESSPYAGEGFGEAKPPQNPLSRAAEAQPPPHGKSRVIGRLAALQLHLPYLRKVSKK
jgi:hypothetical protein